MVRQKEQAVMACSFLLNNIKNKIYNYSKGGMMMVYDNINNIPNKYKDIIIRLIEIGAIKENEIKLSDESLCILLIMARLGLY